MARNRLFLAPALVAMGVAVGCGADQGAGISNGDLAAAKPLPVTPGQQYQTPANGPAAAKALQKDVATSYAALKGYTGKVETVDRKNGKNILSKADVKYLKPDNIRVELTFNSDDSAKAGTKAVYKGGSTIKVKPSGLLGFAKVDLPTSDKRLLTEHGWRIDQISLKANVSTFLDPAAQIEFQGRAQFSTYTLAMVDVKGPLKVSKANHIKMGFDIETKLPVYADFFQGTENLYSMRLMNVSMTPPSQKDFEL